MLLCHLANVGNNVFPYNNECKHICPGTVIPDPAKGGELCDGSLKCCQGLLPGETTQPTTAAPTTTTTMPKAVAEGDICSWTNNGRCYSTATHRCVYKNLLPVPRQSIDAHECASPLLCCRDVRNSGLATKVVAVSPPTPKPKTTPLPRKAGEWCGSSELGRCYNSATEECHLVGTTRIIIKDTPQRDCAEGLLCCMTFNAPERDRMVVVEKTPDATATPSRDPTTAPTTAPAQITGGCTCQHGI